MNHSFFVRFWCAAATILLLTACGGSDQDANPKTVFRYNEPGSITSLDPAFARNIENVWAVNQLFNGLVQMDSNLEVQPAIAHSWEIDSTGMVYTFHLRKDVFFHDHELFEGGKGRAVVAPDVVYSFYRLVDKSLGSPGSYIFSNLDASATGNNLGFAAPNDSTVVIHLKKPFPAFLGILTMQYCSVVPREVVDHYGLDFRRHPVGTGPFQFSDWREEVKLVLTRNPNYFESENGQKLPHLDAIAVSFIKDRQVAFLEFLKGNFDFMSGLDARFKDQLLTEQGQLKDEYSGQFSVQIQPYLKTDYLGVLIDNSTEALEGNAMAVKDIRRAINYGIDREKMVRYLRNNIGEAATSGIVPHGLPSFDREGVVGYNYDPQKAKQLLRQAGFPNGEGLPPILLATTREYEDLCEYMQRELLNIGVEVRIEVIDGAAFQHMVAESSINVVRNSWVAEYADAESFLSLFYSQNLGDRRPDHADFDSYQYDQLYESALLENNDSLRYEIYRQMDRIVLEEAPIIPLYYEEVIRFFQHSVTGLETNAMNVLTLKKVRMDAPAN